MKITVWIAMLLALFYMGLSVAAFFTPEPTAIQTETRHHFLEMGMMWLVVFELWKSSRSSTG